MNNFFTPAVCSTSERTVCERKNLSVYILHLACVLLIVVFQALLSYVCCFTGRTCWDTEAGAADTADLGARLAIGTRLCATDYKYMACGRRDGCAFVSAACLLVLLLYLWFPKHPPWTLVCYFHRLLPMEPPTPLVNAAFPVWAALSFVCVSSRARALLKLTETESITMASSVLLHVAKY